MKWGSRGDVLVSQLLRKLLPGLLSGVDVVGLDRMIKYLSRMLLTADVAFSNAAYYIGEAVHEEHH